MKNVRKRFLFGVLVVIVVCLLSGSTKVFAHPRDWTYPQNATSLEYPIIFGRRTEDYKPYEALIGTNYMSGSYVATDGYYESKAYAQIYLLVDGGLSIESRYNGESRDLLSLKTTGADNNRITFQSGAWLSLDGNDTVYRRKPGVSALWAWDTIDPEFTHYTSYPTLSKKVTASYVVTQITENVLTLTVDHKYGKYVITLQKIATQPSSIQEQRQNISAGADASF